MPPELVIDTETNEPFRFVQGRLEERGNRENAILFYWDQVTDSHETGWNEESVIGRSEPFQFYSQGSAREISLPVHFVAETANESLESTLRLIRAWTYPTADSGLVRPPKTLYLILGSYLAETVVLRGYTITAQPPFDAQHTPMVQPFDLNLIRVRVGDTNHTAPLYSRVRRGG